MMHCYIIPYKCYIIHTFNCLIDFLSRNSLIKYPILIYLAGLIWITVHFFQDIEVLYLGCNVLLKDDENTLLIFISFLKARSWFSYVPY